MYEVGDYVRVRDDLIIGKTYWDETRERHDSFVSGMSGYLGKTMIISSVLCHHPGCAYRLADPYTGMATGWNWMDEMLEPNHPEPASEYNLNDIGELYL